MAGEPWKHDRRSRHERGYGSEWVKLRLQILKRDGYRCHCDRCNAGHVIKPATQVDHKISKANWLKRFGSLDGVDHPSNLQAINKDCHEVKSLTERGYRVPKRIGDDGFPID